MIKSHILPNSTSLPSEQAEKIAQLTLVGQAALNTNLSHPHVDQAVATLFEFIAEVSDELVQRLQEQEMKSQS